MEHSEELNGRLEEIQKLAAAALSTGGDRGKLKAELNRLSSWVVRTQQYIARRQQDEN